MSRFNPSGVVASGEIVQGALDALCDFFAARGRDDPNNHQLGQARSAWMRGEETRITIGLYEIVILAPCREQKLFARVRYRHIDVKEETAELNEMIRRETKGKWYRD